MVKQRICQRWLPPLVHFTLIVAASLYQVNAQGLNDQTQMLKEVQETADEVEKDVVPLLEEVLANTTLDEMTKRIAKIVGWPPADPSEIDKDGLYSRFVQAYHTIIPAAKHWTEAALRFEETRAQITHIHDFQSDWDGIREGAVNCKDAVDAAKMAASDTDLQILEELLDVLVKCETNPILDQLKSGRFGRRAFAATHVALDLLIMEMYHSLYDLPFRLTTNSYIELNLFRRMVKETEKFHKDVKAKLDTEFPAYIANIRKESHRQDEADELQKRLDDITARMSTYPYSKLYDDTMLQSREMVVDQIASEVGEVCFSPAPLPAIPSAQKGWVIYSLDWFDLSHFVDDYNAGLYEDFLLWAVTLFNQHFKVDPSNSPSQDANGVLVGDGEWDWNLDNPIHNMRLAWDLMGAVLEEIKCYMRQSYFFDLRQEAIQKTQLDLSKGALFSGFSRTMGFPCKIEDDLNLTSPYCTAANHEICAPMGPIDPRQRPESIHHGGFSLLKPSWVYKYDESEMKCEGRKDYIWKLNACQCGFRLDCGSDLGVNITCPLVYNDLLRGQCRGSVGYPCKTLPLSPGKHHQTCKSGYCNMKKNSCEDGPYKFHASYTTSVGSSKWEGVKWSLWLWIFLGIWKLSY